MGAVPARGAGDHRAVRVRGRAAALTRGHQLRTSLSPQEIQAQATSALAREGETSGKVTLRWVYVPVTQKNGEVTLRLMVGASLPGNTSEGVTEEPRVVEVDVNATP